MTKRVRQKRCGNLFWMGLGVEKKCGKPAAYIFDKGKKGSCGVCEECAQHYHPRRLTSIVEHLFKVLDHNLHNQGVCFMTQDAAAEWAISNMNHEVSPCYVEDYGGDLVELIYAGVRWVGKEEQHGKT